MTVTDLAHLKHRMKQMFGWRITDTDLMLISVVAERSPVSIKEVKHALHIAAPKATRAIKKLRDRSLLTIKIDTSDERVRLLVITSKGEKVASEFSRLLSENGVMV